MSLLALAADVLGLVESHGRRGCLIGGLAVSARSNPRFTLDVDLAVAVVDDEAAEELARSLARDGLRLETIVEQEAMGRLAMVRMSSPQGVSIDILVASSGIESEIVRASETLEVVPGITIPVAAVGHLIALKLLSVAPGRETDSADLRGLAAVADDVEWARAADGVTMIAERGFARGRDLIVDLATLRSSVLDG